MKRRWFNIDLLDLFFVVFFTNLFIIFSFVYNKFEYGFFNNKQGKKLKIKEQKLREESIKK